MLIFDMDHYLKDCKKHDIHIDHYFFWSIIQNFINQFNDSKLSKNKIKLVTLVLMNFDALALSYDILYLL